jgi:hypothetical protein
LCIANNAKTTGESEQEDESDQEDGNIPIEEKKEENIRRLSFQQREALSIHSISKI